MIKNVTLKDIARKLGVSTATVSYVLNGLEKEKRIGHQIVNKVHKAAKEMGYKPNHIASSLRKGSTNSIGLIVSDISNPFFGQIVKVIEDEARKFNITVISGSSFEDCSISESLINVLRSRKVDGLIVVPTENCSGQVNSLIKDKVPTVLIDRYIKDINVNHVILDNYMATYTAVKLLISKGYKKISLVAYRSLLSHMQDRIEGYKKAMLDSGLSKEIYVKETRYNTVKDDMEKIMMEIFKKSNAVIFATNSLTISGLYLIKKFNIQVPDCLAVIGFDGHEVYDFFQPSLTYIQQPIEEMGRSSVKLLFDQINGLNEITHLKLEPKLIVRESIR